MRSITGLLLATAFAATAATVGSRSVAIEDAPDLDRLTDAEIRLLEKVNRADRSHLKRLSRIVVPTDFPIDPMQWSPMPQILACGDHTPKLIVVHLPSQVFGAYEHGSLIRSGTREFRS